MQFLTKRNHLSFSGLFSPICFQAEQIQLNIQIPNIYNCSYIFFLFLENTTRTRDMWTVDQFHGTKARLEGQKQRTPREVGKKSEFGLHHVTGSSVGPAENPCVSADNYTLLCNERFGMTLITIAKLVPVHNYIPGTIFKSFVSIWSSTAFSRLLHLSTTLSPPVSACQSQGRRSLAGCRAQPALWRCEEHRNLWWLKRARGFLNFHTHWDSSACSCLEGSSVSARFLDMCSTPLPEKKKKKRKTVTIGRGREEKKIISEQNTHL